MVGMNLGSLFKASDFRAAARAAAAAARAAPVAGRMHTGGTVPRTANFRLRGGEVVLNKTQLARLKKAKTAKTKQKVINEVSKRRPKKMKGRGRK